MQVTRRTLLPLVLALGMTAPAPARAEPVVALYAAASLTGALTEAAEAYAAASGAEVATRFGPSGQMRERVEAGEAATLFASADYANPRRLADERKAWPAVVFARNRLCAMTRPGLVVAPDDLLAIMLNPAVRLGVATPGNEPAGDYARALFAKAERVTPGAEGALEAKALSLTGGKDSLPVPAGRNAYAWHIAERRADLFLGYCSAGKAAATELPGLGVVEPPAELAVDADYGLAVVKGPAEQEAAAARFAMFVLSPEGQAILARWGFAPVAARAG
jgi:molybdate transport system substrate-binding protein